MKQLILVVKGADPFAAIFDANAHEIPVLVERVLPGEIVLLTSADYNPQVAAWYAEPANSTPGHGFPAGTLLIFSEREAGFERTMVPYHS